MAAIDKIWVNSADSHVWEPPTLWEENLPAAMKTRGPRIQRDNRHDIYIVDNKKVFFSRPEMLDAISPPGMLNLDLRLAGSGRAGHLGGGCVRLDRPMDDGYRGSRSRARMRPRV